MSDTVRITIDGQIPRKFSDFVPVFDRSGNLTTTVVADVEMNQDGFVTFRNLRFPNDTIDVEQLQSIDWGGVSAQLVFDQARRHGATNDQRLVDGSVAVAARRYRKLSFADHQRVRQLAAQGGPQAVADEFCVSKRQANRYIQRAREAVGR